MPKPKDAATRRARAIAAQQVEDDDDFVPDKKTLKAMRMRHRRKRSFQEKQNHDDPRPIVPITSKRRGGKQTAEELKNPPRRPGKYGGWLRSGGTNKGGKGATPAELRQRCRNALERNEIFKVPMLVIRDPLATNGEKMRAWEALAKFGGLTAVSLTDGDGNPLELPPFIVQTLDATKGAV